MIQALIVVLLLTLQASQADVLAGSWKANLEKSQRDANHQFSELTMRFEVSGNNITLFYSGINRAGHQESSKAVFHPDGKEYPVPEAAGIVGVSTWKDRTLESIARKDGAEIGRSTYTVSADGKTLTATVKGVDAAGRPFEQVILFDRM